MTTFLVRTAALADMESVARLHRQVRQTCLPYLPDLHTLEEDLAFFQGHVYASSRVWLAEVDEQLIGFAAMSPNWLDHLYVCPSWHGRGVGEALLAAAKQEASRLDLWTFQRNLQARRFYEKHGFELVTLADGSGNEEKEPDAQYRWTRDRFLPKER